MSGDDHLREVTGGICAPAGVQAATLSAGIKETGGEDMALLVFDPPAAGAGVFTQNRACAAPVHLCRERVGKAPLRAILVNSGIANAFTGRDGLAAAEKICGSLASRLGCDEKSVLMCSTGKIGGPLPVERMEAALDPLIAGLSSEGSAAAARGIMTTDTRPKEYALEADLPGGIVRIGGISKGAGMIAPGMATMLGFIATDAAVPGDVLTRLLRSAVADSFNCITVDGDTSTNDTVLAASTGVSGVVVSASGEEETFQIFEAGLRKVCFELAMAIVRDGEGRTKVVEMRVKGAASVEEARTAAREAAQSLLVKTALFGGDPNWGRIVAAIGRSGVQFEIERFSLRIGDVEVARLGAPVEGSESSAAEVMRLAEFAIEADLGLGKGEARLWTTDLSYEYVRVNSEYHT